MVKIWMENIIKQYMKRQLHHNQVKICPNNARKYFNIIYPISILVLKNLSLKCITCSLLGEGSSENPALSEPQPPHSGLPLLGFWLYSPMEGRDRMEGEGRKGVKVFTAPSPPSATKALIREPLFMATLLLGSSVTQGTPKDRRRLWAHLYLATSFWGPNFWESCSEFLFLGFVFSFLSLDLSSM